MENYTYTDSEKETAKVLKMQEKQLGSLGAGVNDDADELAELRARIEAELKARGIEMPTPVMPVSQPEARLQLADIPSWDELVSKANHQVADDVAFDQLLSAHEHQYCTEEATRIMKDFSAKTGILNKKDLTFLAIATALQAARWLISNELVSRAVDVSVGHDAASAAGGAVAGEAAGEVASDVAGSAAGAAADAAGSGLGFPSWRQILHGLYRGVNGSNILSVFGDTADAADMADAAADLSEMASDAASDAGTFDGADAEVVDYTEVHADAATESAEVTPDSADAATEASEAEAAESSAANDGNASSAQANASQAAKDEAKSKSKFNTKAVLSWIFGTANLMTRTVTGTDFKSYRVDDAGQPIGDPISTFDVLKDAYKCMTEDWKRLPAAIVAQYTRVRNESPEAAEAMTAGLPVVAMPETEDAASAVLSAEQMTNELASGDLYKSQCETPTVGGEVLAIGLQAALAKMINMIVSLVHGMLYDPKVDGDRQHYELRTRKILSLSNTLSSYGNVIYAAGTEQWYSLDIGGILVTMQRLYTDTDFFIAAMDDFISKEMDKKLENDLADIDRHFIDSRNLTTIPNGK